MTIHTDLSKFCSCGNLYGTDRIPSWFFDRHVCGKCHDTEKHITDQMTIERKAAVYQCGYLPAIDGGAA